jgi:predicted nucleic acid-binding OB-fold protein
MTLFTQEMGLTIGPFSQLEVVKTIGDKKVLQVQMEQKVKTFEVWRDIRFIPRFK